MPVEMVSIVGVDLAKSVFQVHGTAGDGRVLFHNKLSRTRLLHFMSKLDPCIVAMEACVTANCWAQLWPVKAMTFV
jgi:transposase